MGGESCPGHMGVRDFHDHALYQHSTKQFRTKVKGYPYSSRVPIVRSGHRHAMRQYKRKGKLSQERTKKLESIGFVWRVNRGDDDDDGDGATAGRVTRSHRGRRKSADELNDDAWEEKYSDLVEFKKR